MKEIKKRKRRIVWKREMELQLITLWQQDAAAMNDSKIDLKSCEKFSKIFAKRGLKLTSLEIRIKLYNLAKKFRNETEKSRNENVSSDWEFYDCLKKILAQDHDAMDGLNIFNSDDSAMLAANALSQNTIKFDEINELGNLKHHHMLNDGKDVKLQYNLPKISEVHSCESFDSRLQPMSSRRMSSSSSVTTNPNRKRKRRLFWTKDMERILIKLWQERLPYFNTDKKKPEIHKEMAECMIIHGFHLSASEVQMKIYNLTKKFRMEEQNCKTEGQKSTWEHYNAIKNILGQYISSDFDTDNYFDEDDENDDNDNNTESTCKIKTETISPNDDPFDSLAPELLTCERLSNYEQLRDICNELRATNQMMNKQTDALYNIAKENQEMHRRQIEIMNKQTDALQKIAEGFQIFQEKFINLVNKS